MGLACASAFGSHIALVAIAGVGADQRIAVEKLVAAVDCGRAINPGLVDTPFQDRVWGDEAKKQDFANASAAGRIGKSEEMAGPVLFLASQQASFMSGHGLVVDGGYIVQ